MGRRTSRSRKGVICILDPCPVVRLPSLPALRSHPNLSGASPFRLALKRGIWLMGLGLDYK
jgi:hypothetical protein